MNTDQIINAIVADGTVRTLSIPARLAVALAIGGAVAGTLFVAGLGVRPDIAGALQTWRFDAKLAITLVCLAAAAWSTAQLARPEVDQRTALAPLLFPAALLGSAAAWELASLPAEAWAASAVGTNSLLCLAAITLFSVAPLLSLLVTLRSGAPRSPVAAGAAAGLLAGSLAATLYALHCFDDSPLFVALWYAPAIALVTLAGAAAGARALRW
jgi:hypothetical protein